MIFLLSPAKTLDYATPLKPALHARATEPAFMGRAAELVALLRRRTPAQVASLMDLSDELAALNVARYAQWSPQNGRDNSRPAALAFDGDVYDGLAARTLGLRQLDWAQQHVLILSGLYGVLRPLDRLQPYRLEMGTRLPNPAGADLYAWWGDTAARVLNERQADERAPVVVNLASQEYFRSVDRRVLRARVVECVFEDWKAGQYKVISFFAKRARGAMCRWAIVNRVQSVKKLDAFADDGYAIDTAASTPDRRVFRRKMAA